MDLVYILHEQIYVKLLVAATGETYRTTEDRHKLAILASDYMLLATGIIGAASFINDQQTSDEVRLSTYIHIHIIRMYICHSKGQGPTNHWGAPLTYREVPEARTSGADLGFYGKGGLPD